MMRFQAITTLLSVLAISSNAQEKSGEATYYNVQAGPTACGTYHQNTQLVAATAFRLWRTPNPNEDPMCKKTATVRNTRNGKTVTVQIKDKCYDCKPNDIDLTESAFNALGEDLKVGRIKVTWHLNE